MTFDNEDTGNSAAAESAEVDRHTHRESAAPRLARRAWLADVRQVSHPQHQSPLSSSSRPSPRALGGGFHTVCHAPRRRCAARRCPLAEDDYESYAWPPAPPPPPPDSDEDIDCSVEGLLRTFERLKRGMLLPLQKKTGDPTSIRPVGILPIFRRILQGCCKGCDYSTRRRKLKTT